MKNKELKKVLEKLKTLTNKRTAQVIDLLEGGEMFAKQIDADSGMDQAQVSVNMKRLIKHGYVKYRKEGKFKYYSLTNERDRVIDICNKFSEL